MVERENLSNIRPYMDVNTPHGKAQARYDEMLETAQKFNTTVSYIAAGEPTDDLPLASAVEKGVIFNADNGHKRINPAETTGRLEKPCRLTKTHDTRGLNGFYKGTFYKNGIAQKPRKNGHK